MAKDRIVAVRFTEEKVGEIGSEADRKGQTIAGWVRQVIYEKLEEKKQAAD